MHPRKLSLLGTALYVMVIFRGIHQKLQNGHRDCDGRFGMLIMVDAENGAPDIYQLHLFFVFGIQTDVIGEIIKLLL